MVKCELLRTETFGIAPKLVPGNNLWKSVRTSNRSQKPQSRVFAAIPGGTLMGPVIEVQIVKILDQYGLEIAIPSLNERERTSYVMISRQKSRFVDEIHIHNVSHLNSRI